MSEGGNSSDLNQSDSDYEPNESFRLDKRKGQKNLRSGFKSISHFAELTFSDECDEEDSHVMIPKSKIKNNLN